MNFALSCKSFENSNKRRNEMMRIGVAEKNGLTFDEIETDIGTCLPIQIVVSVCLYESSLTQKDSKSNIAKFFNSFSHFHMGC